MSTRGWIALAGLTLVAACAAAARFDPVADRPAFLASIGIAAAAYAGAVCVAHRAERASSRDLALCALLAVAARVPFVAAPPRLSDDVYRYVWDARVQRHGLSPYLAAPADPALAWLADDNSVRVNNPSMPTVYPPVAQWFFRAASAFGGESVRRMKIALVACDLAVMGLLVFWLLRRGRSAWLMVTWAWHPLVIVETAGSGHVDVVGVLLLVLGALALEYGRRPAAALLLTGSVLVKFLPLVLVPLLWRRLRVRDALAGVALAAAVYAPFAINGGRPPLGSLSTFVLQWRFNDPIFALAHHLWSGPAFIVFPLAIGLVVSGALSRTLMAREAEAWVWPLAAALACAPAVFPWYLLWLVPLLTTAAAAPVLVWTITVMVLYVSVPAPGGDWRLSATVVALEYLAVLAAAAAYRVFAWRRVPTPSAALVP